MIKYMSNSIANYGKILEILQQIELKMNFLNQISNPKLSDIEFITVDLTFEYMSIDSESRLFRILPDKLSLRIERNVYNRRRRKLFYFKEQLRKRIVSKISSNRDYCIIDSMPLEVCKLSLSRRGSIYRSYLHY